MNDRGSLGRSAEMVDRAEKEKKKVKFRKGRERFRVVDQSGFFQLLYGEIGELYVLQGWPQIACNRYPV